MPLTGHVDRNVVHVLGDNDGDVSCPSRGTWIEMAHALQAGHEGGVVPLTGHVDRNSSCPPVALMPDLSCPSRGTWIEIYEAGVADKDAQGRAPHGARG